MRRVGILMGWDENDSDAKLWLSGFTQGLAELGWIEGRNMLTDIRWAPGSLDKMRTFAKELIALNPDVILSNSTPVTAALHRETRTIPIVFVIVSDPVGEGFVASVSRPGGNITGFVHNEPSLGGKWVELLREIAPTVRRVAAMFNPDTAPYARSYYLPSFELAARSFNLLPIAAPVHNDADIESVITSLARDHGGLVVMPDNFMDIHRAASYLCVHKTMCRLCTKFRSLSKTAACFRTAPISETSFIAQPLMCIVFFAVKCRGSFPFSCRSNS
jgi:putative ABC transport system substrate-binding protein